MSIMIFDITAVHSRLIFRRNEIARRSASISMSSGSRDVAAVIAFCAIGLIASLLFVCSAPDGISAFVTLMS